MMTQFARMMYCSSIAVALLAASSQLAAGTLIGPGQDDFDREIGSIAAGNRQLNYEFFRPPGYSTAGKIPLVIYLHGYSDGQPFQQARINETMLGLVNETQSIGDHAAFLLVPKIPILDGWSRNLDLVRDLIIDVESRYEIDTGRKYLTGFSDGGFGTVTMIVRYPGLFAAGAPVSGGGTLNASNVAGLKDVPLWFFHGLDDSTVSYSYSYALHRGIKLAGGTKAKLSIVPGGHESAFPVAYNDAANQFYPWLFSQSLAVPEPSSCLLVIAPALLAFARAVRRRPRKRRICRRSTS